MNDEELRWHANNRLSRDFGRVTSLRSGGPGAFLVEMVGVGPIEGIAGSTIVPNDITPRVLAREVSIWATREMWTAREFIS